MIEALVKLIFCHCIGDYVLQCDYLARTKGENWYNLIVHCILYCFPFYVCFGLDWRLGTLFISHLVVDAMKARYKSINYFTDQFTHYFFIYILYYVDALFPL